MRTLFLIRPLVLAGLLCSLFFRTGFTQTVKTWTLAECLELAKVFHPVARQPELLSRIHELDDQQVRASRLPRLELLGSAGVQSEPIRFPFELPGVPSLDLPIYNARTFVRAEYALYDGGLAKARSSRGRAELQAELSRVAVDLHALNEEVTRVYFQLLLLREKEHIVEAARESLRARLAQTRALVRNGVLLQGQAEKLEVRDLELEAELAGLRAGREAARASLSALIGQPVAEADRFALPEHPGFAFTDDHRRPEQAYFRSQQEALLASEELLNARRRPRVLLTAQGGVGYPNPLNFFDAEISPYGMAGLQVQWDIWDWGQTRRDRQVLALQSQLVENREALFDYQLEVREGRARADIRTLEQQLARDRRIAELQERILEQEAARLDQGAATPAEYVEQLNRSLQSRLSYQAHRIAWIQQQTQYLIQKGTL